MKGTNLELAIIKSMLKDRDIYNKYYKYIKDIILDNNIKKIFITIDKYYSKYTEHNYISIDELESYFNYIYNNIKEKDYYTTIFLQLKELDTSDSLAVDLIVSLIEKDYVNKILQVGLPVLSNRKFGVIPEISSLIDRYKIAVDLPTEEEEEEYLDFSDMKEVLNRTINNEGLQWRIQGLNNDVGPLQAPVLGHVYASPESGKTAFLLSEGSYFAKQLKEDECGLIISNEQGKDTIKTRWLTAVCGTDKYTCNSNYEEAMQVFAERGGWKVKVKDIPYLSLSELEHHIKDINPKFVIIDAGDKVSFYATHLKSHERLQELYRRYRELAKAYNTIILTAGQANDDAQGRKWLRMSHMADSRIGKPGELDLAIGIGKLDSEEDDFIRYLSITKNKLKDGVHGKHAVVLDTMKSRYRDL